MNLGKKIGLAAMAIILIVTMVLTWGSIGSGICAYCLIMMGGSLLYQKFITNREDNPFRWED